MVKNNIHQKIEDEREMRQSTVGISKRDSRPIRINNSEGSADAIAMVETGQAHSPTRTVNLRHTLTNDEGGWLSRPSITQKVRVDINPTNSIISNNTGDVSDTDGHSVSSYSTRPSEVTD